MPLLTLSFTLVRFRYFGLPLKTRWNSAGFLPRANFEPLSPALPGAFAFSNILYPLDDSVFLTIDLLKFIDLT